MEKFTKIQKIIIMNLPYGKDNAIPKKKLVELTNLNERSIRQNIAILRKQKGILICSNSHSKGYYYPNSESEIMEFVYETKKRIRELSKIVRNAEKYAKKNKNQVQLVVE